MTSCVSNCGPVLQGHGAKDKQGEDRNRSDEEKVWNSHATWKRVRLMCCQSRLLTLEGENLFVMRCKSNDSREGNRRRRRRMKEGEGGDTSEEGGGRREEEEEEKGD